MATTASAARTYKTYFRLGLAAVLVVCVLANAYASPPIETEFLEIDTASSLDFDVEIHEDKFGRLVTMSGPLIGANGCPALRGGHYILSGVKDQKSVSLVAFGDSNVKPSVIASVADQSLTLAVFIDYLCPDNPYESKRYVIEAGP